MFARIFGQIEPWSLLPLRVVVGIVFLVHGGQKLFVGGVSGFAGFLSQQGMEPALVLAIVVTLVEILGGLAVVIGALTRGAALLLAVEMGVVIFKMKLPQGFFASQGGYEFELTLLGACLTLLLAGAKRPSLDHRRQQEH